MGVKRKNRPENSTNSLQTVRIPRSTFPTPEEDNHSITMAGLLTYASSYSKSFPSLDSGYPYFVSIYSCGYSSGLSPDSLLSLY